MSSGGSLPYQLRPNKAVDRLIFCDLLRRIDSSLDFRTHGYEYYGFGGPHMEDFRLLHECFPEMKMTSIEEDEHVQKRQRFNAPHTKIKYFPGSSREFIDAFSPISPAVVWLDYVRPAERIQQISELQQILRILPEGSILKITLNASSSTLTNTGEDALAMQENRRLQFQDDFRRFFSGENELKRLDITTKQFPKTLLRLIEAASSEALSGRASWRFHPLTSSLYADGQTMLTVTAVVGERDKIRKIVKCVKIKKWPFKRLDWSNPLDIDVPEFSSKERIFVDQMLPRSKRSPHVIERRLGYQLDSSPTTSRARIANYVQYNQHYPHFGRISI